jgi:hypothetical protein
MLELSRGCFGIDNFPYCIPYYGVGGFGYRPGIQVLHMFIALRISYGYFILLLEPQ